MKVAGGRTNSKLATLNHPCHRRCIHNECLSVLTPIDLESVYPIFQNLTSRGLDQWIAE